MKPQSLLILTLVTAAVGGAAYYLSSKNAPATVAPGATGPLFDGLASKAGQIATINVVTKDGETVLQRQPDGSWAIQSKDKFPARLEAVRNLVTDLSAVKIVEPKTTDKAMYSRLGLEDPESKDATSVAVRLVTDKGDRLAGLVIGKPDAAGAGGPMGTSARRFVRRLGEDATYLAEGDLRVERSAVDWAERTVLNMDSLRIKSATLTNPATSGGSGADGGGHTFTISRAEPGGALSLEPIPSGQTLKDAGMVDGIAGALAFLRVDDFKAFDPALTPTGVVGEWRTFDGLVVKATQLDGGWVRFEARFEDATKAPDAQPQANQPAEITPDAGKDATKKDEPKSADAKPEEAKKDEPAKDDSKPGQKKPDEVLAEAKALNAQLAGWMFKLPGWKVEQLTKRLADLVKPQEAAPTPTSIEPPAMTPPAMPLAPMTPPPLLQPPPK